MAENQLSFGGIHIGSAPQPAAREIDSEEPFRILICGDFTGRANRRGTAADSQPLKLQALAIDRDNFDELLGQLDVKLERVLSDSSGQPVSVAIGDLDDFHPDQLFAAVPLFDSLSHLRRRLLNTATFNQAAAEVQSWAKAPAAASESSAPAASAKPEPDEDRPAGFEIPADLFGETLSNTEESARQRTPADDWQSLIHSIVAPYSVPGADPRRDEFVGLVDQAIGKTMQAILHHPDFQTLEGNWRALQRLVRGLETGSRLKLYLVDISRDELAADLNRDDLSTSAWCRLLTAPARGAKEACPYALAVGAFSFGNNGADVALLARLATIAAATSTPLLGAATGDVVGCSQPGATPDFDDWSEPAASPWNALCQFEQASSLALTWPRVLTRMPYGRRTDPIESFQFEELDESSPHDALPWGNGAWLAALAVGEAFTANGWGLEVDRVAEINGLPSFTCQRDGETVLQTPGELILGERAAQRVTSRGIVPVLSVRDSDELRLGRLRAVNGQPLQGRWSG